MVKRVVVGAGYGLMSWLAQRITAVVMLVYVILFAVCAAALPDTSYTSWYALFSVPLMRILTVLFFLALFYHAWVGMRDLFMDYVKCYALRLALHCCVVFALLVYTIWLVQVLWRL